MTEIAAGYFPDYDVQWDIKYSRKYKTQIRISKTGKQQRRRLFPATGSDGTGRKGGYGSITASSDAFTPAERKAVADFLDAKDGAFRAFYYWRRDLDSFTNYYVSDVAAATSVLIPFKDSIVTAVTVADVAKTFSVSSGIGAGGEDRINALSGTWTGAVRITLRGRERWLVHAINDEIIETFIENVTTDNVVFPLAFEQVR